MTPHHLSSYFPTVPLQRATVVAALIAAMTGCGQPHAAPHQPTPSHTPPSKDTGSRVFAFTTPSQLTIVAGETIVATAPTPAEPTHPVLTATAHFAAAATTDGNIVTTGQAPNSSRTIPADTQQVFADHGDTISWWQQPNQLMSLDLSQPSAEPVSTPIELPGGNTDNTRLLTLAHGVAIFAKPGLPDGAEELIRMDHDHTFRTLAPSPEITSPIQLTTPSSDGRNFAYVGTIHAACPKNGVTIVDTNTGTLSSPAMPYTLFDTATTHRTWWDTDHLLHMSMATRPCTTDARTQTMTSWKLEQGTWIRAEPADALASRHLGPDTAAIVTATHFNPPRGTLTLQTSTDRTLIADNVTDLATPTLTVTDP